MILLRIKAVPICVEMYIYIDIMHVATYATSTMVYSFDHYSGNPIPRVQYTEDEIKTWLVVHAGLKYLVYWDYSLQ